MRLDNRIVLIVFYLIFCAFLAFYFWGVKLSPNILSSKDELEYYIRSGMILKNSISFFDIFSSDNFIYAKSAQFLYYYYLSIVRYLSDDSYLIWILLNFTIYLVGIYFFTYSFLHLTGNKNIKKQRPLFFLIFVSLVFYIPLLSMSLSIMRDSIIFSLMSISVFCIIEKKYKFFLFFIIVLSLFRVNAAVCCGIFTFLYLVEGKKFSTLHLKALFVFVLFIIFLDIIMGGYFFRKINNLFFSLSILSLLNEFFRFFMSPLPWETSEGYSLYLKIWFWLSFPFSIIVFLYFIYAVFSKNLFKIIPKSVFFMVLVYVVVYVFEGTLGYRQIAVIAPFFFTFLLLSFFRRVKL